ncbi:MAG: helix-turn-helix transcriptional regulator [Lachnospiraceae bacterium]|nr:helix-turn-helix transcriptional regulator [Lachnospiraceae bacterium]
MTLGTIVKQYRSNNDLSMDEFAKRCSLSKGYISMIENEINPRNNKPIAPTLPSLSKIAAAMNMELEDLLKIMDGKQKVSLVDEKEEPKLTEKDNRDIKKDLDSIMDKLKSGDNGPASYDGDALSPEAMELFRDELEIALKRLKIMNKEKYTPKKYKK